MPAVDITLAEAVLDAARLIKLSGVGETPRLDAEILVAHVTNKDRVSIKADSLNKLTQEESNSLTELVKRRCSGEPIAYLVGRVWFYGREFQVDSRVLVPRPETELLIDIVMDYLSENAYESHNTMFIADVCTGSGCIGASITAECGERLKGTDIRVVGTDISDEALEVAQINVENIAPDMMLREGDLLRPIADLAPFSVIVANPPYIEDEWDEYLSPQVREHEPHIALFTPRAGGLLGLAERLASQSINLLEPNGMLAIEHGQGQGKLLEEVLRRQGFVDVTGVNDLAGIDRVVVGIAPSRD